MFTMDFIPTEHQAQDVPFYDDVTTNGGWQGHTTGKTVNALKAEVSAAITRLGGVVTGFQRGAFATEAREREGYRIVYFIERPDGSTVPGRLDVAALPVRKDQRRQRSYDSRREKSLKMALFMLRNALDGLWFLQQLSPGYAPLMPWMLDHRSGKTVTQLWSEAGISGNLLPPGEDFVEGEFE